MHKKYFLFSLLLLMLVSGCAQKPVVNNQTTHNRQTATMTVENQQTKTTSEATTTSSLSDFATTTISMVNTSDWQIYRNKEYGFELKYPKDWSLIKSGNKIAFKTGVLESAESIEFTINIDNVSYKNLKNQKIEKYKDITEKVEELTIAGEKAFNIFTTEFGIERIFFIHGNLLFEITTGGRIISNGILNNFKFVK
jgi:hypothetical protein